MKYFTVYDERSDTTVIYGEKDNGEVWLIAPEGVMYEQYLLDTDGGTPASKPKAASKKK